jgi:hypothetical protein
MSFQDEIHVKVNVDELINYTVAGKAIGFALE